MQCAEASHRPEVIAFLLRQHLLSAADVATKSATAGPGQAVPAGSGSTPTFTVTRSGPITNVTAAGNLAATKPISCRSLEGLDNTYTPADLYPAVKDCVEHDRYAEAVDLAALAGIYGAFDASRVTDESAGQAGQVLIMTILGPLADSKRKLLQNGVLSVHSDPKALARLCARIRKIGFPSYYPRIHDHARHTRLHR